MRLTFAFSLFAAVTLLDPASAQHTIGNARVQFQFAASGMLQGITDLVTGRSFAIQNDQPWKILFRNLGTMNLEASARDHTVSGVPVTPLVLSPTATSVGYGWYMNYQASDQVQVILQHTIGANDDFFRTQVEVRADNVARFGLPPAATTTLAISEFRVYTTPVQQLSATRTEDYGIISNRGVYGIRSPAVYLDSQYTVAKPSRNTVGSTSWTEDGIRDHFHYNLIVGAYWYNDGSGVYVHPERGNGFHPFATAYRSLGQEDPRFQMTHIERCPRDNEAGVNAFSSTPLRTGVFRPRASEDGWFDFATLYRSYLQSVGFFSKGRLSQRADLTSAIKQGDLLVGWFGTDQDPPLNPYSNAVWRAQLVSMYNQSCQYVGAAKEVVFFFIGWNRTASFAHSLYYPQAGQEQLFLDLKNTGNLIPFVYTLTNTINQTPADPEDANMLPYAIVDIHGNVSSEVNPAYGTIRQQDPSTGAWAYLAHQRLTALQQSYGVSGAYFDSAAPSYPDYLNRALHVPGFGDYQIRDVVAGCAWMRNALKQSASPVGDYMTTTENFPEAFASDMDMLGGDGNAPHSPPTVLDWDGANHLDKYIGGQGDMSAMLFNAAVYHDYTPMVGLGHYVLGGLRAQSAQPIQYVASFWDAYFYHAARAVVEGGGIPHMREIGLEWGVPDHLLGGFNSSDQKFVAWQMATYGPRYADLIKELLLYRTNNAYLIDGTWQLRMAANRSTVGMLVVTEDPDGSTLPLIVGQYNRQDLVRAVWRSSDPATPDNYGLFFLSTDTVGVSYPRPLTFTFDATRYGYPGGKTCSLFQSGVLIAQGQNTVTWNTTLALDKVAFYEVVVQ